MKKKYLSLLLIRIYLWSKNRTFTVHKIMVKIRKYLGVKIIDHKYLLMFNWNSGIGDKKEGN